MPGLNPFGSAYFGQYDGVSVAASYTLTAATGTFTETGQAASLLRGLKLTSAVGAFALSGQATSFLRGRVFVASAGAFTLNGVDAGPILVFGRTLNPDGATIGSALVEMFRADTDVFVASVTSRMDGSFMLQAPTNLLTVRVWIRAWEDGSPQQAGTSATKTLQEFLT